MTAPEHYDVIVAGVGAMGSAACWQLALHGLDHEELSWAEAVLQAPERVMEWDEAGDLVRVTTDRGEYSCDTLVLTPGAYAHDLLKVDHPLVTPTRQVVGWYEPAQPALTGPDMPLWLIETPGSELFYGFGHMDGSPGPKLARHMAGPAVDPASERRVAAPMEAVALLEFMEQWLPDIAGPLTKLSVCIYENSPDGHFIIDRHPLSERVLLACGFSGHGFKFAPVVGEVLAEMALGEAPVHALEFLSLRRFG